MSQVISSQEPWTETLGEIGEILYAIAGWVARMECKRRSERTKAGLDRAIRQGKKLADQQAQKIQENEGGEVCSLLSKKLKIFNR